MGEQVGPGQEADGQVELWKITLGELDEKMGR